jgi:hypothetical protein
MNKQFKLRDQPATRGQRKADGRAFRGTDGAYYDRDSGRVGYGRKYGERSYNNRPIHTDPAGRFRDEQEGQVPFGPFDAPKPKD